MLAVPVIEMIAVVVITAVGGGWFLLREISSQLRTLRQELENKMDGGMQQLGNRMDGGMQQLENRMDGRMKQLEDGQIDLGRQVAALGRQVARLEGLFDGLRRPLPEESRAV